MYSKNVSDVHTHLYELENLENFQKKMCDIGYSEYNLLSGSGYFPQRTGSNNLLMLLGKSKDKLCSAFVSLDEPDTGTFSSDNLLKQIKRSYELGFDGLKMMEGKPNYRRRTGKPLDSEVYEPVFEFCEEKNFPVLLHVNDPRSMWDYSKASEHAKKSGWAVPPDSTTFDEVVCEMINVLKHHPKLRVVLAHMFFSEQLEDTIEKSVKKSISILDEYPNVNYDLAPGRMIESFSERPDLWKPFLEKYSNRILFGTDHYDFTDNNFSDSILRFYATDDTYDFRDEEVKGIKLSEKAYENITYNNYHKFFGESRRKINFDLIDEYIFETKNNLKQSKYFEKICNDIDKIRKCF